jgi:D-serine deaminase-like pyridoxal phosphate-dependent protein
MKMPSAGSWSAPAQRARSAVACATRSNSGPTSSRVPNRRAILGFGKRDASYDDTLPKPLAWFRSGMHKRPESFTSAPAVVTLNDQHAFLDIPPDSPLAVGDMVSVGISHPCTTFDKWQLLPVVDDDYTAVEAVRHQRHPDRRHDEAGASG